MNDRTLQSLDQAVEIAKTMNRRRVLAASGAAAIATPAKADDDAARFRDALERIALLDEADGHELTKDHAHQAVAIATSTLGKHPSEIFAERHRR